MPTRVCLVLSCALFVAACGEVKGGAPGGGATGDLADGQSCAAGNDCESGLCVDGVCCDRRCDGQCEACDVAGSVGACTAVIGAPHGDRPACTGTDPVCAGACDGVVTAACAYPTTECRGASCTGTARTAAASCDLGVCPDAVVDSCAVTCGDADCVTAVQITAGYYNACALMSDGTVRCWGQNPRGQNGIDPDDEAYHPVAVPALTGVKQITTANSHTCALLEDETVKCWGSNLFGELGQGGTDSAAHPVPMLVLNETRSAPLAGVQSIAAGQFRTCAVVKVGSTTEARCWGWNGRGALGNGTTVESSPSPTPVCSSGSVAAGTCVRAGNVFEIATGREHTCARFLGGNVACWGANHAGQLGFAKDTAFHPNPVFVKDGAANLAVDTVATAIGETGDATCAVRRSDKVVLCWGTNLRGQLGRSDATTTIPGQETPAPVCNAASGCPPMLGSAVSLGYQHGCAIALDKVRCWGSNNRGQLGDDSINDKPRAIADVATAGNVRQVAAGEFHTCALLFDGRVQCWGIADGIGNDAPDDVLLPAFPTW